ncbi:hypothetical protein EV182_005915, partial [Spiromyces aspiralis]
MTATQEDGYYQYQPEFGEEATAAPPSEADQQQAIAQGLHVQPGYPEQSGEAQYDYFGREYQQYPAGSVDTGDWDGQQYYDQTAADGYYYQQQAQEHSEQTSTQFDHQQQRQQPTPQVAFPLVCFGFGGRMVTMFPYEVQRLNSATGVTETKKMCGAVNITSLSEMLSSASDKDKGVAQLFATGPLFNGDTTKSTLKKQADAASQEMRKLIDNIESGRSGVPGLGNVNTQEFVVMCKFIGAWLSTYANVSKNTEIVGELVSILTTLAVSHEPRGAGADGDAGYVPTADFEEQKTSGGSVEEVERFLLGGQRQQAAEYCIQHGMWAHALVIASCAGKDTWQRAVTAFSRHLSNRPPQDEKMSSDFSALGLLYRLFAGMGRNALAAGVEVDGDRAAPVDNLESIG